MLFEELFQNRNQLILEYTSPWTSSSTSLLKATRKHKKYLKILMGKKRRPQVSRQGKGPL